jgi:peptidoglycan/LPS O-acetylase OafA/YrhL
MVAVMIVSHFTFMYIEEPFRRRTKAWLFNRASRQQDTGRAAEHVRLSST